MPFVRQLLESGFRAPMLETQEQLTLNFLNGFDHPRNFVLGCEEDGVLTGVFSLAAAPEDKYLEIMLALSENESACTKVLAFLRRHAPGYVLDCVIHPSCMAMRKAFTEAAGLWYPAQRKLRLGQHRLYPHAHRIVPCDEAHRQAYVAMHETDCYWTAERVLAAPERFHALVALSEERVIGYLDVTKGFAENEVYDWRVQEEYRNRGIGTALLDAAVCLNGQSGLMLLCGEEELPAQKAAHKLGFAEVEGAESITGTMTL